MMQIPHTTAGLEYEILRLSKSYSSRNPTALEILQLSKWLPEMIAAEEIEGDTTNLLWCAEFLARARTSLGTAEGKILQDTREQLPYDLPGAKAPIKTGDYVAGVNSVAGLKNVFTIERKSLTDMVACCGSGRERFERELERAKSLQRFWLVIEGSLGDILNHNSRSRIHPNAVTDSLVAWSIRVPGGEIDSETITTKILAREAEENNEPKKHFKNQGHIQA